MPSRSTVVAAFACLVAFGIVADPAAALQSSAAHTHIAHVMEGFDGAPEGGGLLPTALAEAETVQEYVGRAAQDMSNLDWMQQQAESALHALDPGLAPDGPGLGLGVEAAAQGIVQHVELAASSEGASENVQTHATHVSAAATAVAARAEELAGLAQDVLDAADYSTAEGIVTRMRRIARELIEGVDSNEDGEISIAEGEGGLQQVQRHMELMVAGENLE